MNELSRPLGFVTLISTDGTELTERVAVYTLNQTVHLVLHEPCTVLTPALYDDILGGNRIDAADFDWGPEAKKPRKVKRKDLPATFNIYFNLHIIPPVVGPATYKEKLKSWLRK